MKLSPQKKGFVALLATQFLGAFNDNAFKLVIAFIAINQFVSETGGTLYLSLSGAIFLLPFLLFSTYAGFLADRFSKRHIIIGAKVAELFVMGLGLIALLIGNIWAMLTILFFMGLQSAFFSPSKYGIIPEILPDEKLSEGNGLIQMWTNAAIILGTAAGGYLIHITKPNTYKTGFVFIGISLIGILTSLFVTKVKPSGSKRSIQWNFLGELFHNIKWIKKEQAIFLSILGLAYFGFLGGLFQLNILLYAKKVMGVSEIATSGLLTTLTLGIGIGSLSAGKMSGQKIELGLVPLGAIGLSFFSILLGFIYNSYAQVLICLFLLGISCGFYIVPLNALVQHESPPEKRGQVLATNNFISFSAILIGCCTVYVLRDIFHLNAAKIFISAGILTIFGTGYICRLLPYALARFVVWILTHTIYRVRVINKTNIPQKGGALLVSNHVSFVDGLLIAVSTQRPVRFMINRKIYNLKLLNPLFRLARAIPITGTDKPKETINALNKAKEAISNGELVCIFAEGRLTRTGNMLKFRKGLEHIMKDVAAPIIPVNLDRIWGSIFSFEGGKYYYKIPKMLPYPVTVSFGEPMPATSSAFQIRCKVLELGAEAFQYRLADKMTLPEAFYKQARRIPFKSCIADSSGRKLNYGMTLVGAVALANQLKKKFKDENNIGIMLPPSVPGVLANIAVSFINKVPVNLNYTTSYESLTSILKQCDMKYVLTSKTFLDKANLNVPGEKIYIEDILKSVSKLDKIKAFLESFIVPIFMANRIIFKESQKRCMTDLATIMFTSGSTGEPKGVMLTHANITSNLEGLYQIFHVKRDDAILGILPLFHSFGFTATLWFPLISGIQAVYHVNPLDAKMVGKLTHKHQASILMSTPTFLSSYTRRCTGEQFKSLRVVVVGAEKLKATVADAFKEKFNIDPMEGYGCTELSPIASINLPDYKTHREIQKAHKPGKIGLPLPGVAARILNPDTLTPTKENEDGLLFIKGPNVMKGYLNRPEITNEVIQDGWYKTGDIANIDEDGFLMITGRLSRFSKIAGEMVPHIKVEEKIQEILNTTDLVCAVTSVPDEKKGEKLAVLCLHDVDVTNLIEQLKQSDLPNLWIPASAMFLKVAAIPLLGTGKLDLGTIKRLAAQTFQGESS
ncbi:MAG: MFS transporter [Candidatus Omnitrophica bacterium]|nr:MFS transporter [Candidatus Omnitrophota bacterium]